LFSAFNDPTVNHYFEASLGHNEFKVSLDYIANAVSKKKSLCFLVCFVAVAVVVL
jgi:t-SNARE complex subunit (syntaxin)